MRLSMWKVCGECCRMNDQKILSWRQAQHDIREFVEMAFGHIGSEIEWKGERVR